MKNFPPLHDHAIRECEIRDLDRWLIAQQSALTRHLVLSVLHADKASSAQAQDRRRQHSN